MFRREGSVRALSGFVALSSLAFCSIFLFSNWGFPGSAAYGHRSLDFEIEGGFPRILEQIAAPAAVIVVAGWNAISASSEERAKSAAALRAAASP
jgi:hypothetical protein